MRCWIIWLARRTQKRFNAEGKRANILTRGAHPEAFPSTILMETSLLGAFFAFWDATEWNWKIPPHVLRFLNMFPFGVLLCRSS